MGLKYKVKIRFLNIKQLEAKIPIGSHLIYCFKTISTYSSKTLGHDAALHNDEEVFMKVYSEDYTHIVDSYFTRRTIKTSQVPRHGKTGRIEDTWVCTM